eukprot:scaffold10921_cov25-Tisochrysis_lutea.AAC.1
MLLILLMLFLLLVLLVLLSPCLLMLLVLLLRRRLHHTAAAPAFLTPGAPQLLTLMGIQSLRAHDGIYICVYHVRACIGYVCTDVRASAPMALEPPVDHTSTEVHVHLCMAPEPPGATQARTQLHERD